MKDGKLTAVMLLLLACSQVSFSQQTAKSFRSAGDASQALYEAVRDDNEAALRSILGGGPELLSSGDLVKDKAEREQFVTKYQEMHRLVHEPDGSTVLHIGAENWPFPVPLIVKNRKWSFDADTGSQEILAREIGRNEVTAVQVCQAFQNAAEPESGIAKPDPIRNFAASLKSEKDTSDNDGPFYGYYFRTLSGKAGDVAVVAYPAEYRSSGVMTFVITSSGVLYEKDLGPDTPTAAQQVQTPSKDWVPVEQ